MTSTVNKYLEKIFPTEDASDIAKRIEEHYDFINGFPMPSGKLMHRLSCPVCNSEMIQARRWVFSKRGSHDDDNHRMPYRCEINLKCRICGKPFMLAPALTEGQWNKCYPDELPASYHFREVRELLKEANNDNDNG